MTERDRAAGRLLLERGLASSDALRRCALTTQERRQRGEQIEVLQVLVEQGALDRALASSLWRELQGSGSAPRPAPSSDRQATTAQGGMPTRAWGSSGPPPQPNFSSPDATPTIGPGEIARNMPGFPGAPQQGYGSGSFNAPGGGFGPPPQAPPQGYGSGSFNAPGGFGPPQGGFGSGSFNAPGGGFAPPQGYGSGSFNAPGGFGPPPQAPGLPQQGYGSGSFNAPGAGYPQQGFGGGFGSGSFNAPGAGQPGGFAPPQPSFAPPQPGFGPAPGVPNQLPPTGQPFDPTALTIRSPVGGLDAPPIPETVRSPDGFGGEEEDLAATVKSPSGRVGPPDFQSDFDPIGDGFGDAGPPVQQPPVQQPPVQQPPVQQAFPADFSPGFAGADPPQDLAPEPAPLAEVEAPQKPRGSSSRVKKGSGRTGPVSGRVRAARAKRAKKTSPMVYVGGGVALLVLLIVIVVVVATSGPAPEAPQSPAPTPSEELPADDTPADEGPSEDPGQDAPPPRQEPSRASDTGEKGAIPAKYREPGGDAASAADDLEADLVLRADHMVEQAEYKEALALAREALATWPAWLKGKPGHERYQSKELPRREKQVRFAEHLESLTKKPKSRDTAKMIGAIAGQHLHADLSDLPCVEKFKGDMTEILGEMEYDAIFVQEFDPKELQDDFRDDQ